MTTYSNCYDLTLSGQEYNNSTVLDFVRGFVWCECPTCEQTISYGRFIATVNGIDVYYDYGADYYFFVDVSG